MQAGTYSYNEAGTRTYGLWWEVYPWNSMQYIGSNNAAFGDTIYVHIESGKWATMTVVDETKGTGGSFDYDHSSLNSAQVEWIEERPSFNGELPYLANVSTKFTSNIANVGQNYIDLAHMKSPNGVHKNVMTNCKDAKVLASPGAIAADSSFTVSWKASGDTCPPD